jgi:pyrroloquinoline-quinone synthase
MFAAANKRRESAMPSQLTKSDFLAALEAARRPKHGGAHPFSIAWAKGELTRAQLGQWAIQHHYYIDAVPQQFGHLFMRYPDLDARHYLLENLLGEENPADRSKRHPDLLVKFGLACGVKREDFANSEARGEILPSTRAMRAWVWELTMVRQLAESAAGIMVALEGQLPTLYPGYVKAMEKMGFSRDELDFFWVHIENDDAHAGIGLELTHRYATTPELQQKAIAAVRASAQMRWQMLDGTYALLMQKKVA